MIILQRQQQSHGVLLLLRWDNLFLLPATMVIIVLFLILCIGSSDSSFVDGATTTTTTTTTTRTNITFTIQKNNCSITESKIHECSLQNRYCHSVLTIIESTLGEESETSESLLLTNDMATEFCSYCKQGYIDFGLDQKHTNTTCKEISTITIDDYLNAYKPYYKPSWDRKLKSDNMIESIDQIHNYYMNIPDTLTSTTIIPHTSTTDDITSIQSLASSLSTLNKNIEDLLLPTLFFYQLGLTPFSADDSIDEEQRSGYFYVNFTSYSTKFPKVSTPTIANADLPVSVDWRNQPDVMLSNSPVINQGRCACSWATSLVGSIEGSSATTSTTTWTTEEQYQGPSLPSSSGIFDFDSYYYPQVTSSTSSSEALSIQQLISCNSRNLGCDGGNIVVGMLYASTNTFGGLASERDYPFVSGGTSSSSADQQDLVEDGSSGGGSGNNAGNNECQLNNNADSTTTLQPQLAVTIDDNPQIAFDYYDSAEEDYDENYERRLLEIKQVLTNEGPISVVMKSSCKLFSNYVGGILTNDGNCFCNQPTCADHAVLLVGFNDIASSSTPYFILKNSWGTNWGENGYFRIAQYPPTDNENRRRKYGLFGILGFGLLPGTVTNLMVDDDGDSNQNTNTNNGGDFGILEEGDSVTQDGNDDDLPLPMWAFFLIACAGLVVCWCCCECITMLRRKKQHHGHHEHLED